MPELRLATERRGRGLALLVETLGARSAALVAATAEAVKDRARQLAPEGHHPGVAGLDHDHTTLKAGLAVEHIDPWHALVVEWAPHGPFVEYDTRAHGIDPIHAIALHFFLAGGEEVWAHHVDHPGTTAQPFLHPAAAEAMPAFHAALAAMFRPGGRL